MIPTMVEFPMFALVALLGRAFFLSCNHCASMAAAWSRDGARPARQAPGDMRQMHSQPTIMRHLPVAPPTVGQEAVYAMAGNATGYVPQHPGYGLHQPADGCGGSYFQPVAPLGHLRQGCEYPPGLWAPAAPQHTLQRVMRDRSRSPRRPEDSFRRESAGARTEEVARVLSQLSTEDFKQVFFSLPARLREAAYSAPDDIVTDVKSIMDKDERMSMCRRVNEFRRERLRHLATPQAAAFYEEDSTKIVPMSRVTEWHFWDVFHRLPMSTTDSTKWKAVLKYLDGYPEKPRAASGSARDVDWASGDLCLSPARDRKPAVEPADSNSREALRRLAVASPQKPVNKPGEDEEDYVDWVKRQVDVDTADMTFGKFELDSKAHCYSRKCAASKALRTLTPLEAMSDIYTDIFRIYYRKLERLVNNLSPRTKEAAALKKLCDSLNVEQDDSLAELLARLRALDIMRKPL